MPLVVAKAARFNDPTPGRAGAYSLDAGSYGITDRLHAIDREPHRSIRACRRLADVDQAIHRRLIVAIGSGDLQEDAVAGLEYLDASSRVLLAQTRRRPNERAEAGVLATYKDYGTLALSGNFIVADALPNRPDGGRNSLIGGGSLVQIVCFRGRLH